MYSFWLGAMPRALLVAIGLAVMLLSPASSFAAQDFDAQASQVVAELVDGRFADVRARFDATMTDQLSEEGLATAWRSYQELFGPFQSADQPTSVMRGDLTVEQVPVHLANSDGEIRIAFHPDGSIAGLFFLRPGVPVP